MRLFATLPALSVLASLIAPTLATPVAYLQGTGLTGPGFSKRQDGIVSADICATINVILPTSQRVQTCTRNIGGASVNPVGLLDPLGLTTTCTPVEPAQFRTVTLLTGICLCLDGGVITDDSVARVLAQITLTNPGVALLLEPYAGQLPVLDLATLLTAVDSLLRGDLAAQLSTIPTSCVYPPNSTPNSCTACGFSCDEEGFEPCGNGCILAGTCPSGVPVDPGRKRHQLSLSVNLLDNFCPGKLTACANPGATFWRGDNYECIDTTSDIESCGACAYPLPGQPKGVDCTAIANVDGVDCVAGQCIVKDCQKGFELDGDACVQISDKKKIRAYLENKKVIAKRQVTAKQVKERASRVAAPKRR